MTLEGLDILLAEDNPTNQTVAIQMLETLGGRVTLAVDGLQALETAREARFDVFLIDIEMPRLSGIEVIRKLREPASGHADKPMIALTAYVMPEHRLAISDAGADGVIAKPIMSIEGFGTDIRQMMSRRSTPPLQQEVGEGACDAGAEPAINAATLNNLKGMIGDAAMSEILQSARADIETVGTSLREAGQRMDLCGLRAASHTLISVAGTIGADRLYGLAKSINAAVHADDAALISEMLQRIAAEQQAVLSHLDRQLA